MQRQSSTKENKHGTKEIDEALISITHNNYTTPTRKRKAKQSNTANTNSPEEKPFMPKTRKVVSKAMGILGKKGHATASAKGFIHPPISTTVK